MENFINKLKEYLETTPRDKVFEAWANTVDFDQVGLPMDDFLTQKKITKKRKKNLMKKKYSMNIWLYNFLLTSN